MSYLFDDGFIVFDNSHDQINQHIENSLYLKIQHITRWWLPQDSAYY